MHPLFPLSSRRFAFLTALVLALWVPIAAGAASISRATASCSPAGGVTSGELDEGSIVGATCSAFGIDFGQNPPVGTSASAQAGGAVLSTVASFNAQTNVDQRGSANADSVALDVSVTLRQDLVPPVPVSSVPLIWVGDFTFGLVGATGTSAADAAIGLSRFTNAGRLAATATDAFDSSVDPPRSTLVVRLDYDLVRADLAAELVLSARAACSTSINAGVGSCDMRLLTDNLAFDQETFDQRMGAATFELSRFFAIVPEPTTASCLLLVLAGFALRRRG